MAFKISWPGRSSPAHADDTSAGNRSLRQNTTAPASRTNTSSSLPGLSALGKLRNPLQGRTPGAPPLPPRPAAALNRSQGTRPRPERPAPQRVGDHASGAEVNRAAERKTPPEGAASTRSGPTGHGFGIKVDKNSGWKASNFDTTRPGPSRHGTTDTLIDQSTGTHMAALIDRRTGTVTPMATVTDFSTGTVTAKATVTDLGAGTHMAAFIDRRTGTVTPMAAATDFSTGTITATATVTHLNTGTGTGAGIKVDKNAGWKATSFNATPTRRAPVNSPSAVRSSGWDNVRLENHRTWPALRLYGGYKPTSRNTIRGYKLLGLEPDDDLDAVFALARKHAVDSDPRLTRSLDLLKKFQLPDPEQARSLDSLAKIEQMEARLDEVNDAVNDTFQVLQKKYFEPKPMRTGYDETARDTSATSEVLQQAGKRWADVYDATIIALMERRDELEARGA